MACACRAECGAITNGARAQGGGVDGAGAAQNAGALCDEKKHHNGAMRRAALPRSKRHPPIEITFARGR